MKRVLVVDENKADAVTIEQNLLLLGCQVTTIRHGNIALHKVVSDKFDVAVVDIDMTCTQGSTIEAIRQATPSMPIVAIGHGGTNRVCTMAQQVQAQGCVCKPINEQDFSKILSAVISGVSCQTCCITTPMTVGQS